MIKVVQFGEGNFLRTFADVYFDILNDEGYDYRVNIVKPIPYGSLDAFQKQNNRYHVVLRGMEQGREVEKVRLIRVIEGAISPFEEREKFYALAREKDLKFIVSNTTEAGIQFDPKERFEDFASGTYPAKLVRFLFERYRAGMGGVYILPVELIDNNADELKRCVDSYISLWNLPKAFYDWNNEQNYYCNTLVDRIVSGHPKTAEESAYFEKLLGEKDDLLSVGEPFGLWAVEQKGDIAAYLPQGEHGVTLVLTDNIEYYKRRKVRVLNGSHTNIVAAGLWEGASTVYDCMRNEKLSAFLNDTLAREIVPFVSSDTSATSDYARSVQERFRNPFLNHRLASIALNSISKWKARDLPTFSDYYRKNGCIPPLLTIGFSYLMQMYSKVRKTENGYVASLPAGDLQIMDDSEYLAFFAKKNDVRDFMVDKNVWGEDLTVYKGFAEEVKRNMKLLSGGKSLL